MKATNSKTSETLTIKVNLGCNGPTEFDAPALKIILDSIWTHLACGIDQGTVEAESTYADGYWSSASFEYGSTSGDNPAIGKFFEAYDLFLEVDGADSDFNGAQFDEDNADFGQEAIELLQALRRG